MDFSSVGAALGIGECLVALVPFAALTELTSFHFVAGDSTMSRIGMLTRFGEAGAETIWLELHAH